MGRGANEYIDYTARGVDPRELEDPHNEFGLLDFDASDTSEHPEWEIDNDLSPEYLAKLDSDAQIADYRMNGYE